MKGDTIHYIDNSEELDDSLKKDLFIFLTIKCERKHEMVNCEAKAQYD